LGHKTALIFPGQGSQYVGMGQDLYQTSPAARAVFEEADEALGFSISKICFSGPEEVLGDTVNTQPALVTTSVACLRALEEKLEREGQKLEPAFVAGHSLGEYSALVAGRGLSFATALRLSRERGRLMKEAGERLPGGMAAVIGLEDSALALICQEASDGSGRVEIANFNSPGQTVISGERRALERARALALERSARHVIPLAVSVAGHCYLMRGAAEALAPFVPQADGVKDLSIPLVSNITARPLRTAEEVREELVQQLTRPVQWVNSVRYMIEEGVETFVEIGPGNVLSGLIRRIDGRVRRLGVGDATTVAAFQL